VDYSVGQLARLAGISVRTLHHYDDVKLLVPSGRTSGGYRRYAEQDVERLQRILFYRELGFPLEEIGVILDDPEADALTHLRRQHELLTARQHRLVAMITAVEREMEAQQMGISLSPEERFEVFGEHDPGQYADEVRERWGETDAYRTSQRRTAQYTKEDWLRIKAEAAEVDRRFVAALADGVPAASEPVMDVAEEHRQHISRWFYDCPYEMHRGLGDMYLADPRFTERYEQLAPGLAQYARDAIHANADRPH
jgi:MerR family transcriptional regulator, thiopeptide resistance regulator